MATQRLLLVLFVLLGACASERRRPYPTPDAALDDASSAASLALAIEAAYYDFSGDVQLVLDIRLANSTTNAPAPLAPSHFQVRTADGVPVIAMESDAANACRDGVFVVPGESAGCTLVLPIARDAEPIELVYASEAGSSHAAIVTCGEASSNGLCRGSSDVCIAGACVPPCSNEFPDGACLGGATCAVGSCVFLCSAEHPDGVCLAYEECLGGFCQAPACAQLGGEACWACVSEHCASETNHCVQACQECVESQGGGEDALCDCARSEYPCVACDFELVFACAQEYCAPCFPP